MAGKTLKYQDLVNQILQIVPKENIQDVFCCMTRLRLIVKDKGLVDKAALEKIDGIIQVRETGNQFQLVIGTHVQDVYSDFCDMTGFSRKESIGDDDEIPAAPEEKGSLPNRILDTLSSIFLPIMPAFVAGGMIKSLVAIITTFEWLQADDGVITVLTAIGDAPFYFLPFLVGATTAKRFKLNEMFGIMIAGCLMYPTFLSQTAGESIRFIFFDIPAYSYASSVLPTVLSVIAFSHLFRLVDRFIPANVKIVFSGMIAFAIFMPILLAVVAPLGDYCGQLLSTVTTSLFNTLGPLAGGLFAGLMPFIIMAGMHSALGPIMLQNFATLGYDMLFPAFFVSNLAVSGATLGASFKIRNAKMKSAAVSSGALGILGVTEPALYSIDTKYGQPLIGAMVGGAAGGVVYMLLGVKCYVYAAPSIFSLAGYLDGGNNVIFCIISIVVAFVVAFIYSFIMTKDVDAAAEVTAE